MTTDARRVALVTGARGGIGRAVVDRMRADGIRVAAFDRTPAEDESSPDVLHLCGDVVDERAVAEGGHDDRRAVRPH
jgi:NAD(P)-dependent dehydrogenase (short-subunit alcohol dehydrogenase family)